MDQVELFQRCAFYFYVSHAKFMKRCSHQMIGIRTFILFMAVLKGHLLDSCYPAGDVLSLWRIGPLSLTYHTVHPIYFRDKRPAPLTPQTSATTTNETVVFAHPWRRCEPMSKINDGKTDYSRKRKHGNRSSRAADSAIPRFDIVHLSHVIGILFGRHGDQNTKECRLRGFDRKLVRIVHPYPYTFTTFAKLRWVGRTVLDVYNTEFGELKNNTVLCTTLIKEHEIVDLIFLIRTWNIFRQLSQTLLRISNWIWQNINLWQTSELHLQNPRRG